MFFKKSFQGVTAGFLVSLGFNIWLIIGRLFYKTSKTQYLPLSTEGCYTANITLSSEIIEKDFNITTILPINDFEKVIDAEESKR